MVCEDDVQFVAEGQATEKVIQEFLSHKGLDVLCLAYRLRGPRIVISRRLAIANNVQTTSCYILKRAALPLLLANFTESEQLLRSGVAMKTAALDIHWKKLQRKELVFAIPRIPLARQRPSFSDITKKFKDYRA